MAITPRDGGSAIRNGGQLPVLSLIFYFYAVHSTACGDMVEPVSMSLAQHPAERHDRNTNWRFLRLLRLGFWGTFAWTFACTWDQRGPVRRRRWRWPSRCRWRCPAAAATSAPTRAGSESRWTFWAAM